MMGHIIMSGIVPPLKLPVIPVTGIPVGDLAVGNSVYLMEDGVATEYLIVNQGIPSDSSLYDSSCDGTWLLRKDIIENRVWDADGLNVYETSDIHTWLNTDMLAKYDSIAQNAIKQVKIPYRKDGGSGGSDQSGANGLSCKVFMLSGYEVGWSTTTSSTFPVDGAKLDYFESNETESAKAKRIAYLNSVATIWWLRSPSSKNTASVWYVHNIGTYYGDGASGSYGVRPTLILPNNALFDETTLILKGVA